MRNPPGRGDGPARKHAGWDASWTVGLGERGRAGRRERPTKSAAMMPRHRPPGFVSKVPPPHAATTTFTVARSVEKAGKPFSFLGHRREGDGEAMGPAFHTRETEAPVTIVMVPVTPGTRASRAQSLSFPQPTQVGCSRTTRTFSLRPRRRCCATRRSNVPPAPPGAPSTPGSLHPDRPPPFARHSGPRPGEHRRCAPAQRTGGQPCPHLAFRFAIPLRPGSRRWACSPWP